MGIEKTYGSIKRFGARYGRTVKFKLSKIEKLQRKRYKCPSCNAEKVKRVAKGIWECRKCGNKFAGKAYTVSKKVVIQNLENVKKLEDVKEPIEEGKKREAES